MSSKQGSEEWEQFGLKKDWQNIRDTQHGWKGLLPLVTTTINDKDETLGPHPRHNNSDSRGICAGKSLNSHEFVMKDTISQ